MRTTCLLGSLALISAVAIGPAMAAGGKSHAILVPGTSNKMKTPTVTVPTVSPGFQPQQDPLGPPPAATTPPSAASSFQPHQDPLGPRPDMSATQPDPISRPAVSLAGPGLASQPPTSLAGPGLASQPPTSLAGPGLASQPPTSLAAPGVASGNLKTTPTSTSGHTWRLVPPPPRSAASPSAGTPSAGVRPIDPKPRPGGASTDMSPAEE